MTDPRHSRWRLVLALAALHVVCVFPYPWEEVALGDAWFRPSPDLALLLSLTCLGVMLSGAVRAVAVLATTVVVAVPLYRFGMTLMPVTFGKEFEPHVDIYELPGLPHLLLHTHPVAVQVLAVVLVVSAVAAVVWLLYRALVVVARACTGSRFAAGLLGVCQLLVVGGWLDGAAAPGGGSRLWRAGMLRAAFEHGAAVVRNRDWWVAQRFAEQADAVARELATTSTAAAGLAGADVYVLFIESYGRDSLTGSRRQPCVAALRDAEQRLDAAAFASASGWIEPPVRGGGSTMAHAELLSGIWIPDRRYLDLLLNSDARPLPALLRDAGYHTVDVQPAMPREAWPEAAMLGFAQEIFAPALEYRGATYHWGMPDQYALNHLLERVVRPARKPLFVQYVSVISHAPFHLIPPYYDDWSQVSQPDAFAGAPAVDYAIDWMTYAQHPRIEEAYVASIVYTLRTCAGFALELERPSLVIVLGDHQPPLSFPESVGSMRDVPVHVFSNRDELIEPLLLRGLHRGIVPAETQRPFKSARFLFRFLDAYGRAPAGGR